MLSPRVVAVAADPEPAEYPLRIPFPPNEEYPELAGRAVLGEERNPVYGLLRRLFYQLGMDTGRFGAPGWNPLGDLVRPGDKVVIKPNLVRHLHLGGGDYRAVVTHGSVIRAVLDYAALALGGRGEITVADAPVQSADFETIMERTGLPEVVAEVANRWKVPVRIKDLRLKTVTIDGRHRIVRETFRTGDDLGYLPVDLGESSLLSPLKGEAPLFRVTNYDSREMVRHHNETIHEYLIPRTVLEADVIINLPKLKTHRKVGLTAALKNMVGVNGCKDWLPHHRRGSPAEGGDEYLRPSLVKRIQSALLETEGLYGDSLSRAARPFTGLLARLAARVSGDKFTEGSWYGNDTLWRTVLDLNRLVVYADREGKLTGTPQRRAAVIVDAVIGGEGEGPMEPDARRCGFLAGGLNPVAVDAVLAAMIGFDYRKIPLIAGGFKIGDRPLADFAPGEITVRSDSARWNLLRVDDFNRSLSFRPPRGWAGHIESGHP